MCMLSISTPTEKPIANRDSPLECAVEPFADQRDADQNHQEASANTFTVGCLSTNSPSGLAANIITPTATITAITMTGT